MDSVDRGVDRVPILEQLGDAGRTFDPVRPVPNCVGPRGPQRRGESCPQCRRQGESGRGYCQPENHRRVLPWLARMTRSRSSISSASASS